MSIYPSRLAAHALAIGSAVLLFSAAPATAQRTRTAASDSSWIVPRVPLTQARKSLRTQDAQAAVLLMDTTLVLQFTDEGLSKMTAGVRDSASRDIGNRFLARLVGSALGAVFDHGIAYDLRALRSARVEGNRLVFEDLSGKRVLDRVEINGRDVMEGFSPAEASRFAAAVNQALHR